MERETHDRASARYWSIREQATADPEYLRLRSIMEELEGGYEAILRELPQERREVIELYLTCRESLNSRMLELACMELADLK